MIITVANQKGGVGKTTTTINLAYFLSQKGSKVLVVDLDPQANLSSGIGFNTKSEDNSKSPTIYDILVRDKPAHESIVKDIAPGLDLLPSGIELAGAEIEMVNMMSRESVLKRKVDTLSDDYDYIFIDCPPSLGLLTINSLVASDKLFIPVQCEYFALEGLGQLLNTIKLVRNNLNGALDIGGVIMTMHDARTNLGKQVISEVRNYFKDKVFDSVIPRSVRLSEAPSYGKPVALYDPNSTGAKAYERLADEVLNKF